MAEQTIVRMGDSNLVTPSLPVTEFNTPELAALLQNMQDTMHARNGVGIAAPQIGINLRVIMFGFEHNPRYPTEKGVPFTILINPEIEFLDDDVIEAWEGCLSIPGFRGLVPRHTKLNYSGFDEQGHEVSGMASGFHARIIQHEMDHINGKVYPMRIKDLKNFGFEDLLAERIWGKPLNSL
jgi:peptide deformylase